MSYLDEVNKGMELLANEPNSIFVGQAVEYLGHSVTKQVMRFPAEKRLEFPVAEEFQAGFCLGLALEGLLPICIYPRCNFAILAANQIINHIDKWKIMTGQEVKILIKCCVGAKVPLDPGWQHKANYSSSFKSMCEFTPVYEITRVEDVVPTYQKFINSEKSALIIEHSELY